MTNKIYNDWTIPHCKDFYRDKYPRPEDQSQQPRAFNFGHRGSQTNTKIEHTISIRELGLGTDKYDFLKRNITSKSF